MSENTIEGNMIIKDGKLVPAANTTPRLYGKEWAESGDCWCMGPQTGETLCPCDLKKAAKEK